MPEPIKLPLGWPAIWQFDDWGRITTFRAWNSGW